MPPHLAQYSYWYLPTYRLFFIKQNGVKSSPTLRTYANPAVVLLEGVCGEGIRHNTPLQSRTRTLARPRRGLAVLVRERRHAALIIYNIFLSDERARADGGERPSPPRA